MNNAWIIVAGNPAISHAVEYARAIGGLVTAAVLGDEATAQAVAGSGVDRVVWIESSDTSPLEAYGPALAELIAASSSAAVVTAGRGAERTLVAAVASRLNAPVLQLVRDVEAATDGVVVTRGVFGGIANETVRIAGPVVLISENGGTRVEIGAAPIEKVPVSATSGVEVTSNDAPKHSTKDLGSAKRVVAVGRGVKTEADVQLVEEFAQALGAELACSRPLSEGLGWFPHDRYIGVTGQTIAPDLYVAVGISGQLQHVVGCRGAKTVVVINTDKSAPYFKECDYGVVGDLYSVIPALSAELS